MNKTKRFPPGAGWIPLTVAVLFALLLSTVAFTPQFFPRVLVGNGTGPNGTGPNGTGDQPGVDTNGSTTNGGGLDQSSIGQGGRAGQSGSSRTVAGPGAKASCNAGDTAPGVSAGDIHVAATTVTDGLGAGFLGEAQYGIQAAINEVNNKGGICGRKVSFEPLNTGWDRGRGKAAIDNWIANKQVFALVGQPDSEGLDAAILGGSIERGGLPVVGTDGLLKSQYGNQWVWPVAASTVTNMHIVAKQVVQKYPGGHYGIIYDTRYKFGTEGAKAFAAEVQRLGGSIDGSDQQGSCGPGTQYCGFDASNQALYNGAVQAFNGGCSGKCDAVVALLEPLPMEQWMQNEGSDKSWFKTLFGGEPLFDDQVASHCDGCGNAPMHVWTGYHPAIQPFDAEAPVSQYKSSLLALNPGADPHNEFTQGAYVGSKLFLAACQKVADSGKQLTRDNLKDAINHNDFDFGLTSAKLSYGGGGLPHIANSGMAEFDENFSGTFNGWSYLQGGFIQDPAKGQDL